MLRHLKAATRLVKFSQVDSVKEVSKLSLFGQRRFCSKPPEDEFRGHPPAEDGINVIQGITGKEETWIPEWENNFHEPVEEKRRRLMYQSRKRGMLENGLILGTFASIHVPTMDQEELVLYDRLINLPSNDWEIYYWATEVKDTPEEFDNKIMDALKEHTKNRGKEVRNQLPELNYKPVSF